MTVKDGARRISKLMLALALACAMAPSAAYASDDSGSLPIDKAKETLDVGGEANPHHTGSCDGTDGDEATECKACGQSFYACQINDARALVDADGNAVSEDDPAADEAEYEFRCPACGKSLMDEGADPDAGIDTLAAGATALSMTVPIVVTFGGSAGYDIANPQSSIEAPVSFRNGGSGAAMITKLSSVEASANAVSSVLTEAHDVTKPASQQSLADQELFSLYPEGEPYKAVSFKYNSGNVAIGDTESFSIGTDRTLKCTYRLNLTNNDEMRYASAKILDGAADGKFHALAKVTYTIAPYAAAGTGSTGSAFYLKDISSGEVYGAQELKRIAESISVDQSSQNKYYAQFNRYVTNDSLYECKTTWGGIQYDVRLIGINHDKKSSGDKKAGLTFQFKNLLSAKHTMNPTNANAGGWGASVLRDKMNPGGNIDEIWDIVPAELQDVIEVVDKAYGPVYNDKTAAVSISHDKLFLASYLEHAGSVYSSWSSYQWLSKEGAQYEFYKAKSMNNWGANDCLKKGVQSASGVGTAAHWWERSVNPGYSTGFLAVNSNGAPSSNIYACTPCGVCPCFSL